MSGFSLRASFHRLWPDQCPGNVPQMKTLFAVAMMTLSAGAGAAPGRSVSLTQDPLVMRLNRDEFRIAFGINGERCGASGCSGTIRYRVHWKAAGGAIRTETRHVSYTISPLGRRTIAVDRQYFHTGEGRETTDVVKVSVDAITCVDGVDERKAEIQQL